MQSPFPTDPPVPASALRPRTPVPYVWFFAYIVAYLALSWGYLALARHEIFDPGIGPFAFLFGPLFGLQYTGEHLNTSFFWLLGTVVHLPLMLGYLRAKSRAAAAFWIVLVTVCWFGTAFMEGMALM